MPRLIFACVKGLGASDACSEVLRRANSGGGVAMSCARASVAGL